MVTGEGEKIKDNKPYAWNGGNEMVLDKILWGTIGIVLALIGATIIIVPFEYNKGFDSGYDTSSFACQKQHS